MFFLYINIKTKMFANSRKYSLFIMNYTLIVIYLVIFILIFIYTAYINVGGLTRETLWQDLTYEIQFIYSEI